MIKLEGITSTLADLAEEHYRALNQKVTTGKRKGEYKKASLIFKLEEEIRSRNGTEKHFFAYLLDAPTYARLKTIIKGDPAVHHDLINQINARFPGLEFREKNNSGKWVFNDIGSSVNNIFDYTAYRRSTACKRYLAALGLYQRIPCPYCNLDEINLINFTGKSSASDTEKALLDLDHFFAKSKYPYLAVSLFNLIPSCLLCNQRFKGDKEFALATHIHPFQQSFDDFFSFELTRPYLPTSGLEDIILQVKTKTAFPSNSLEDFEIMARYAPVMDRILKMLQLLYKKPDANHQQIADLISMEDQWSLLLNNMGIPRTSQQIKDFSLGKLKRDICLDQNITL